MHIIFKHFIKPFQKWNIFLVYGTGNINLWRKGWITQEMVLDQFAI